jgi:hypothetical protein
VQTRLSDQKLIFGAEGVLHLRQNFGEVKNTSPSNKPVLSILKN